MIHLFLNIQALRLKKIFYISAFSLFVYKSSFGQLPSDIKKISVQEILKEGNTAPWIEFLNTETMRAGILQVKARTTAAPVISYQEDAVYYILKGEATAKLDSGNIKIVKGSILYVHANVQQQFSDAQSDLLALAIYSKAIPSAEDKKYTNFLLEEISQKRISNDNVWEPFIKNKTMTFGLYMLPKALGGDSTLTHKVDELNFVTSGSSQFSIDNYTMDVSEGDIIFVGKGRGHYFHNLKNDFDVLIFWEKKSLGK